jgi:hypothetical protein
MDNKKERNVKSPILTFFIFEDILNGKEKERLKGGILMRNIHKTVNVLDTWA